MARNRKIPLLPARKATKTVGGSSYQAQGLSSAQQPKLDSELGSSQPVTIREFVPELISPYQRLLAYTRMMNDSAVNVSMRVAKTPILGADFYVEPYSADPQDVIVAKFIEDNLFNGAAEPFLTTLEDILHYFEDGYTVLEKVYEQREWIPNIAGANAKNYTMLKKLAVRPSSTITGFTYDDNGEATQVQQSAIRADKSVEDVELDFENLLVFTFGKRGGDLTGRSLLRTAYPHWYYKTQMYKIDAIQKERHALGIPKGMLKPGFTQQDRAILRQLLQNLRTNEEAFMVLTPNVDVEFAEVNTVLVDVLASAEHHNVMILMNVMAQFLAMGLRSAGGGSGGSGGGRGSSGSQQDIFMKSLKFVANYIADIYNIHMIPELVVWNFPTNNFPKLCVRNIGETRDLQTLASGLASLFSQEAITPDLDTENWIRKVFDMPFKTTEPTYASTKVSTKKEPTGDYSGNGNGNGNAGGQKGGIKPNAIKTGNKEAPVGSAFGELGVHLDGDVIDNHFHFDEDFIPTPNVTIINKDGEEKTPRLKSAVVTRLEDGSPKIDYTYEDD